MKIVKKNKKKIKDLSIYTKISLILGILFFLTITTITNVCMFTGKKAIESCLNRYFMEMTSRNSIIAKQILDETFLQANNMNSYVIDIYPSCEKVLSDEDNPQYANVKNKSFPSVIYKKNINLYAYNVENYLIKNITNTIKSNDYIVNMGIFFTPNSLTKNVVNYSLYAKNNDSKTVACESYGDKYVEEDWFSVPIETKKTFITKPYVEGDKKLIKVSYPIIYNGKAIAVSTIDIELSSFNKISTGDTMYKSAFMCLVSDQNVVIHNSNDADMVGKKEESFFENSEYEKILEKRQRAKSFNTIFVVDDVKYITFQEPIEIYETQWWLETLVVEDDFYSYINKIIHFLIIISNVFLVIVILIAIALVKKILRPLTEVLNVANTISEGNFDVNINVKNNDEIGQISLQFKKMIDIVDKIKKELITVMNKMVEGDWTIQVDKDIFMGDWRPIADSTETMISRFKYVIQRIDELSNNLTESSEQVSSASMNLSQSSAEQASSVEELFAAMSDICEQIGKSSEYANQCKEIAIKSKDVLDHGNEKMVEMNNAMNNIAESASKIGDIIKTINDIASQTNILALNAAIEAARAGVAGQGFAVVADEVRNLAQKSTVAAKNTQQLIENTINTINSGAKIVESATQSIQTAVESSTKTEEFVNTIAKISEEQFENVKQITTGIEQISSSVQTNSTTAEETAALSEELDGQAKNLNEIVSQLSLSTNNQVEN